MPSSSLKSTPHANASVACVHADGTGMGRLCACRRDGNGSASIHFRHTECLCVCVCVCVWLGGEWTWLADAAQASAKVRDVGGAEHPDEANHLKSGDDSTTAGVLLSGQSQPRENPMW
jgi:hypothetical protein